MEFSAEGRWIGWHTGDRYIPFFPEGSMSESDQRRLNRATYALSEAEFYLSRVGGVEADGIRAVLKQLIDRCKKLAAAKKEDE